ncbi:hypothetical protein B7463_g1741, partial [Scytalidium lignicola]
MAAQTSYEMSHIGAKAFNHASSRDTEAEYDRLRDLARQEASKRNSCFERSQRAYSEGDGAMAKKLSDEGKAHAAKMDQFNQQASDYIFRENNAAGRVADDTIDLHGQFVEEAERILEQRIRIVGKGNHSVNHIQKIKPRVEQVCQELGLQYATEENAGRMYINLQGGPAVMPPYNGPSNGGYESHQPQHHGGHHQQQPHHGGYQQPQHAQYQGGQSQGHSGQQGGNAQDDELEELAAGCLKKCCAIM